MIVNILARWVLNALAIILIAYLLEGISVSGFYIAFVLALILGFLNAVIRPILVILTLPINIITLGFFTLILNGVLFWFPSTFVEGFSVANFWWAILGAFLASVFGYLINLLLKDN